MVSDAHRRLDRLLRAGARGVVVCSPEEERVIDLVEHVGEGLGWPVHTWSAAQGIDRAGTTMALSEMLCALPMHAATSIWILLDPLEGLADPFARRTLRELCQRTRGPAVVLVDPRLPMDSDLVLGLPELCPLTLDAPAPEDLEARVDRIGEVLESSGMSDARAILGDVSEGLSRLGHGLTASTFERLLAEAILDHGLDGAALERFIADHKAEALGSARWLEPVTPIAEDELGGLDRFKAWLHRRALALHPDAQAVGIPLPRGVLLVGVQGCGKSLAARVCGSVLTLPTLRLDPGRLFGGTVGESERNLRQALALVERSAPTVLWLDEVDKGLAGAERSSSDAGTTSRVVGSLLTWLQERAQSVFVVATANRIDALPPELLRRGRLDELFFVDLPDEDQRTEILRIHLERVPSRNLGAVPPCADPWSAFARVVAEADGFSGAEIEAALVEARLDAFSERRPVAATDLARALRATVPLSVARAEEIEALRRWASARARFA